MNRRLMEWNGNVEQTSKANQDDRYLQRQPKNASTHQVQKQGVPLFRNCGEVIEVLAST